MALLPESSNEFSHSQRGGRSLPLAVSAVFMGSQNEFLADLFELCAVVNETVVESEHTGTTKKQPKQRLRFFSSGKSKSSRSVSSSTSTVRT